MQDMSGKQAKTISENNIKDLLIYAECTRHPVRNQIIVLLSAKAGLRAGEIAKLKWGMVLDANGGIGRTIELRDDAAKNRGGRPIPVHSQLRDALAAWRLMTVGTGPVVRSERGGPMKPLSIVVWFSTAYPARSVWKAAPPIRDDGRSSPERPGWSTRSAARCGTFSSWQVTGRSKSPRDTLMAIVTPSAN
jgi:integrase